MVIANKVNIDNDRSALWVTLHNDLYSDLKKPTLACPSTRILNGPVLIDGNFLNFYFDLVNNALATLWCRSLNGV